VTAIDMAPAEGILEEMGGADHGDLIPLLQKIQDTYGYLPREVLLDVSAATGIPASHMYGVATFYAQFHLTPRGKHLVQCCRGTACHVRGGNEILRTVTKALGIEDGQTSDDLEFTLETVACLGTCALAPLMVVDGKYHGKLTPRKAESILKKLRKKGDD
jgi:NADH-quinone oxidoreductase subunit E